MLASTHPLAHLTLAAAGVAVVTSASLQPASLAVPVLPEPRRACVIPIAPMPDYLQRTPELWTRRGDSIVRAPAEDQRVAASYARSGVRGELHEGVALAILTARTRYRVGESVRVIHVLEAPQPGHSLHVMGPKSIHGELVDGIERTPPDPGELIYDGVVLQSPGVDFHYDVTSYRFDTPGTHHIEWRIGPLVSNTLTVEIVP